MGTFQDIFRGLKFSDRNNEVENATIEDRVAALEAEIDYLEETLGKAFARLDKLTDGGFDGNTIMGDSNPSQTE